MVRRPARLLLYVGAFSLFWAVAAPSAHAYIDPGSSSFIIQILVGALAGAGLAIATFWRRIRTFFARVFGKSTPDADASPPGTSPPGASPSDVETDANPPPSEPS